MGKFKYKIKEINVGDVEYSKGKKSTVTDIDPETGAITWSFEDAPDFESVFKYLKKAKEFTDVLAKQKNINKDEDIQDLQKGLTYLLNNFRTHIRNEYPNEYNRISNLAEELTIASNSGFTSGGEGENHTGPSPRKSTYGAYTQAGYKKVTEGPGATMGPGPKAGPEGVKDNIYVKDFKYKLVNKDALAKKAKGVIVKKLWEAEDVEQFLDDMNINDPSRREFIGSRLRAFDNIEEKLNQLIPLMQQAKSKTIDYYRNKPESYAVVYGTDLAQEYLNDLIELFKN